MKTQRTFFNNVLIGVAALCFGVTQSAVAALTVDTGYKDTAEIKGAVRYRNFNSQGGGNKEVYTGLPNPDKTCCDSSNRATNDVTWASPATWNFTFEYDGSDKLKTVLTKGSTSISTEKSVGDLADLNYLQFDVNVGNANKYIQLTSVNLYTGATEPRSLVGPITASLPSTPTATLHQIHATGVDLSNGFKVQGSIGIVGSPQLGGDGNFIEIKVGYYMPPDNEGPITSNVHVTPEPVLLNGSAALSATVDDSTTGGSNIASASYRLNGGFDTAMDAENGAFDEVSEDVSATLSPLSQIGVNTVCVKGTDAAGNTGDETCEDFIVTYAFDGFYAPIDNNAVNVVKAGQAVPAKWWLADANGVPIADAASFAGLYSYMINCETLTGNPTDAVEEYAAGDSGLQYNGEGYWQYNWKTPKTYAGTCRAMYIAFDSTTMSPVVLFKFK